MTPLHNLGRDPTSKHKNKTTNYQNQNQTTSNVKNRRSSVVHLTTDYIQRKPFLYGLPKIPTQEHLSEPSSAEKTPDI